MKNALILFTRVPIAGKTKTRLIPFLGALGAARLHKKLIRDIEAELKKLKNAQIFVFFTPEDKKEDLKEILSGEYIFKPQCDGDLDARMADAFKRVFALGFEKAVLIGSDIVNLKAARLKSFFKKLSKFDAAINPSFDGGYCAIGLKSPRDEIFGGDYTGRLSVCDEICARFKKLGLSFYKFRALQDIDEREDIFAHVLGVRRSAIKPLASGEYNVNFKFRKLGREEVFRINTKSQMALKNQIKYEFDALKILQSSGVTPKPLEYFAPSEFLPRGALSMEFLRGRALRYESDLRLAAALLAKIHAVKIPPHNHLIVADKPLAAMHEECEKMAGVYLRSKIARACTSEYLKEFLRTTARLNLKRKCENPCIINTELNSENFIIGKDAESSFVIDWEKPLIGEREQDLAHFTVPTTTFWKTDAILSGEQIENFLKSYEAYADFKIDPLKFKEYFAHTCLRGVSWCAMALVEYSGARAIKNEYTLNKIKTYLSDKFLSSLQTYFKDF